MTHWLWLWGRGGATSSWPRDTADGFVYVPTVLMAKSSLPEQSVQGVCTQPTAAEVNQRQRADEYGQMALNSGTFCSWTRPRQSRNESQNCSKVTLQCLQYSRNAEVQRPKWSFFFFFLHNPPSTANEQPNSLGSKVCGRAGDPWPVKGLRHG